MQLFLLYLCIACPSSFQNKNEKWQNPVFLLFAVNAWYVQCLLFSACGILSVSLHEHPKFRTLWSRAIRVSYPTTTKQCFGSGIWDWVAFLTPGSGMGESLHPDPGSGVNNPDHIFQSLETIFQLFLGLKYLNSLMRIRDPGWRQFGSGIRDKHPGSATLVR